jgi:hypothetical protein
MALLEQYLPESVSPDAEVMVLGRHGYETVAKGKNSFVGMVLRSWTADTDDPDFWNPKLRAPICFNAPAARSYLPIIVKKTDLILASRSKAQMAEQRCVREKRLTSQEPGAMCYLMSKQGYLSDRDGHWHPHVMFFAPLTEPAAWGAEVSGSPILGSKDALDRLTIFMIPVGHWSDATPDGKDEPRMSTEVADE